MAYSLGNLAGVAAAVVNEFRKVALAMNGPVDGIVFNTLYAEPSKPTEGLTVKADGVQWMPNGIGLAGLYQYRSGTWVLLG